MSSKICDGYFDCPDSSDEWDCFVTFEGGSVKARMDNNVYGSICADGWTQDWSDEVCVSMNYQGQVSESEFNTTLQDSEYFLLNSTLTPNEVSHVQAARSNFEDEPCDAAVNFECQSFECGKWALSDSVTAKLTGEDVELSADEKWQSLGYLLHLGDQTSCTVSIIGPRWIMTSHSCVSRDLDALNWAVVANGKGSNGNQIVAINRIVSHPFATKVRGFHQNDIALIELTHNLEFDELVQPICLGDKVPEQGDMCIIAGVIKKGEGVSFQQYLEHIPVPVVDKKVCNSQKHYNGHLAVFDICTGARTDKPTCKHDTGAPLMCLDSAGSWKLSGILSHEGECLNRSHPDVFTSVVELSDWISKTIGRRMS